MLNDLRFMDNIYRDAFVSFLKMHGANNIILHGCGLTDNGDGTYLVAAGAVVINMEFYLCAAHSFSCDNIGEAYFVVSETYDPAGLKKYGDDSMKDTYLLSRVVAAQHTAQPENSIGVNAARFASLYVQPVSGMGLSHNDFTNTLLAKLNSIDNDNVKTKVLEIGSWDMYNDVSTFVEWELPSGCNIVSLEAVIKLGDSAMIVDTVETIPLSAGGYIKYSYESSPNRLLLRRNDGGVLDDFAFAGTGFNRGYIEVRYKQGI